MPKEKYMKEIENQEIKTKLHHNGYKNFTKNMITFDRI